MRNRRKTVLKRRALVALGIVALLLIIWIGYGLTHKKPEVNTAKGVKQLQALEKQKVADAQDRIVQAQGLNEVSAAELEATDTDELNARYENTIVMGDSVAEGLEGYGVLDASRVVASRGNSVANLEEYEEAVISLAPANVVMSYGLNDLKSLNEGDDSTRFIEEYSAGIDHLQEQLRDVKIFICSITPVSEAGIAGWGPFSKTGEFNDAIQQMCREKEVTYIDNTSLVKDYAEDGIHPGPSFYEPWAVMIADRAEL
ncbi:GDSL-type esterase/lipase family protein [Hespellia stercorisuis]|nr:GDSL-type esterase/lipase family protein [Hespellia stercorisuis]